MLNALSRAQYHATSWLSSLGSSPINATASEQQLRRAFDCRLPDTGAPADEVIDFIANNARDGLLGSPGGGFFAWVIGGSLPSALAADWLVSAWDQNAALYACSPASAIIEEVAGEWLKQLFDLPREASFAFTTGCQMAHMTALAAARYALLDAKGWNVEEDGLFGAPPIAIFTTEHHHGSVERALRYLGFGRKSIVPVKTDVSGGMNPGALTRALQTHPGPSIVVLNAADLNAGIFDDFNRLIPIAKSFGAWTHIDGAFGLFARASKSRMHLVDGIDQADSWVTDGHKWLNVPFDCGICFVRNSNAHRAAMTLEASYVTQNQSARDQINWNPEWSRRARGIPVYAALKELGREGVADLVDRCCEYCHAMVTGISALPGAEMVAEPGLNQGLVRFVRDGASDADNDVFTDNVITTINATGKVFFSGTTWRGKRAMRISVVNWQTSDKDVKTAIQTVADILAGMRELSQFR